MNKQGKLIDGKVVGGIEWVKRALPDGTERQGFTWNVGRGCKHGCEWNMPDGTRAQCYAKEVAEGIASAAYPDGFEVPSWHEESLEEPLRVQEPARIFLDSMSDLMGVWNTDKQIEQVLDVCRRAHWHEFLLLTKNAPRLRKFKFSANVQVGASVPPSIMHGKEMTLDQQRQMLRTTLTVLAEISASVKWISFEPLAFDVSSCLAWANEQYGKILQWAVIGAASNGPTIYQPKPLFVRLAIEQLREMGSSIFFKGNLRGNPAADPWLEEFPVIKKAEVYEQRSLI